MSVEQTAENKLNIINYCLMQCVQDNYIKNPETDIQLDIAQTLLNEFGLKGGLIPYTEWSIKYYKGTPKSCQAHFDLLKKQNGKDRLTMNYIINLSKPYDDENKLIQFVTDDTQYATSTSCSSSEDYEHGGHTPEYKTLTVLLTMFIRNNVNTPRKVEDVIRCAINYCKYQACVPLWNWRNEFEIMKKEQFSNYYTKYMNFKDNEWRDYNLKKLYQIALKYDNEDENCKTIYYQEFPEEKKQTKEEEEEQNEEDYLEMKEEFEKCNFQAADTFYNVYNKTLRPFNKTGFTTMYEHLSFGEQKKSFISRWYKDPEKRLYQLIDFLPPPIEVPSGVFNTWDIARDENENIEIDNDVSTDIIYKFFHKLTFCGEEGYEFLLKYVAHLVKYPATKPEVGIFFTSEQGSGKDTFYKLLKLLIGETYTSIDADPEDVFGKYNLDTRLNKLVLILQEADNLKSYTSKIKDLITCKVAKIANKGIKQIVVKDYSRLFVFSNNDNILKIESGDRRWVIFNCFNFFIDSDPDFFNELHAALDNPMVIQKFKQELMDYDISMNYNFQKNRPMTDKYSDLKSVNAPSIIRWAYTFCDDVDFVDEPVQNDKFTSTNLCDSYNMWCKNNFENSREINCVSFGLQLKKYFYINDIWRGFEKNVSKAHSTTFRLDKTELNKIITEKYGFKEII